MPVPEEPDDLVAFASGESELTGLPEAFELLVSLGDLLDRGAESRKVMDLLMKLQSQAPASGGHVHVVIGNHELMNLTGDMR